MAEPDVLGRGHVFGRGQVSRESVSILLDEASDSERNIDAIIDVITQDDTVERLTIRPSNSLRQLDLGGNKLRSVPTGLLSHSTRLRALYLDDNRLTDCSGLRALESTSTAAASRELIVDLSDNLITEPTTDCLGGRVTSIYLAGNPLYCGSCVTAQFVASMSTGSRRISLLDRNWITCAAPSNVADKNAFGPNAGLPDSWQCRYRDVVVGVVVALLSLAVILLTVAVVRRRLMVPSFSSGGRRRSHGRPCSTITASSTVTISNGCYGNGSLCDGATPSPMSSAMTSSGGCEPTTTRYSPLIEDDSRHDVQMTIANGHNFWQECDQPNRATPSSATEGSAAVSDDYDGAMSSTVDIKCPLIGNGTTSRNHMMASNSNHGTDSGNNRLRSPGVGTAEAAAAAAAAASRGSGRADRTHFDSSGNSNDDVEDSL
jgi:hypothetical protein